MKKKKGMGRNFHTLLCCKRAKGELKFLIELFTKSSWGYGGNAPVTPHKKQ